MFARPRFFLPGFVTRPFGSVTIIIDGGGGDDELITATIIASEALTAGEFVQVWNDSGTPKVRKADGDNAREIHGYVLANVSSAAIATVYFNGINDELSGLTPGVDYYLAATPGDVIAAPGLVDPATLNQHVGFALSATELLFQYSVPIMMVAP